MSGENPRIRAAVTELAADLHRESQKVRGEGKRPATREEAQRRAIEVAIRHERNNRNR